MKMISVCLVVVLVLNTYGLACPAEPYQDVHLASTANAQHAEKVKIKIQQRGTGEKARVKIRLRDKTEVKGYISQIDATSFQVTDEKTGKAMILAYSDVETVGGRGMSRNTKIVIFVGLGIAAAGIILGVLASALNHS